jgi:hypothetical protein
VALEQGFRRAKKQEAGRGTVVGDGWWVMGDSGLQSLTTHHSPLTTH